MTDQIQGFEGSEAEVLPEETLDQAAASEVDDNDGAASAEQDAGEQVVVTIGDEELQPTEDDETEKAPQWVKDLRKGHRELQRKTRELEAENKRLKETSTPAAVQVRDPGPKPTLADCDFDEEKFETALTKWHEDKSKVAAAQQARETEQAEAQKQWQQRLASYAEHKQKLRIPDFEDAEASAMGQLSTMQQGIIVHGAKNPALVVYALGKNPKKLDELSKINDPVRFAFATAELESQLKVSSRKPSAQPETGNVRGTRSPSGGADIELERLRDEAAKTGDSSKVIAYKRALREKARKK